MLHLFVLMCWSAGSPECYALASREPMAEHQCLGMMLQGSAMALSTQGAAARIEQFGVPDTIEPSCLTYEEAEAAFADPRLK